MNVKLKIEIMNLNENQVQIIDSLKTEFLRINETNKQHKAGKLIDFNQMASDKEEMRKKRDEDRAISKANKSRCEEEFYKAIDILNEDLKYVGLEFKYDVLNGSSRGDLPYFKRLYKDKVKCEVPKGYKCQIDLHINGHTVDYGGYFKSEYHHLDTFQFFTQIGYSMSFKTIEEFANSAKFVQFVKDHGDFDSAAINDLVTITCDNCGMSKDYKEGEQFTDGLFYAGFDNKDASNWMAEDEDLVSCNDCLNK